ncbi:hypothetical protein BGW41_001098 [Actinomortierella wolfii]|nr:hypothetical protein BGW41_001098 [Actinomortierella wolfii]
MGPGVIAVIGTTGVGKSNLSIQLAKELKGEVINADALQVYKGLDIITNKMPLDEREGIEHHLMDFLPLDREYSVIEFKDDALKLIKEIHDREHMPVVVGGTHYYIQSLLWRDTLLDTKKAVDEQASEESRNEAKKNEDFLRNADTATLYKKLQEIDPIMAKKWHENDRRKISRSLQVYFETGERQSDLIKKQHAIPNSERLRMPSCIFWVYSEPNVLNARLDARVDTMIQGGLFDEIQSMRKMVGPNTDYERGIWQAIGYKEFDPYFAAIEKAVENSEQTALESWEKKECEICTQMQRIMQDKFGAQDKAKKLMPVLVHGQHEWEQHLKSRQHRKCKTFKTEMERDGPNWWFWKAQEHKKRKWEEAAAAAANADNRDQNEASESKDSVADYGEGSSKHRRISVDDAK